MSNINFHGRLLYLDFDGVLHPATIPFKFGTVRGNLEPTGDELFQKVPDLHATLNLFPDVRIVISSSWRNLQPLAELVELLGPLGELVVGTTGKRVGTRYEDIAGHVYLAKPSDWVALDDDDHGWPDEKRENLIHCNFRTGLTEDDLVKLQERLGKGAPS